MYVCVCVYIYICICIYVYPYLCIDLSIHLLFILPCTHASIYPPIIHPFIYPSMHLFSYHLVILVGLAWWLRQ